MTEIIPGILEKEWKEIEHKIQEVSSFAPILHIDLIDGVFAPNKTFSDPMPFAKYADVLKLELHMMVDKPEDCLEAWAEAGFRRFIGQIEMMESQVDFVAKAQLFGEVGLAIDSPTSPEEITAPYSDLDFLFVMTVKAGFSGQKFIPENLDKVRYLRQRTEIPIEVDGGINSETIVKAHACGADRFVSTGYIFGTESKKQNFLRLQELVSS